MTTTGYPNREHQREVESQTSRAVDALAALADDALLLKRRLEKGSLVVGADAKQLAERAMVIAERLTRLDMLRQVREWHAADLAEASSAKRCHAFERDAHQPAFAPPGGYCRICGSEEDARVHQVAVAERHGFPPPTHRHAGSDKERQQVGKPGHCEECARRGHVAAHPDLGCGDVGCNDSHAGDVTEPCADCGGLGSGCTCEREYVAR